MSSLAPDSLASSIAWRTACSAVSEPSVPTTMRPNIQSSLVWNRAHTTPPRARRLAPAMGTVETVGGPIDLEDLGTTLVHEHLGARDEAVHAQWPHAMTIAEEEPLHEVGPDGAHDIERGIQGTEIKAAFIKCAADEPGLTENVVKVHRAAARASVRTGAPIMAHSRPARHTGLRQIEIFEEESVDLGRVQIAHTGDTDDLDHIEGVLEKGVYIGMDRFGLEFFLPIEKRNPTVLALLER